MNSYSQDYLCYKKCGKKMNFLLGFLLKISKKNIKNSNLVFQQILRSTYILPLTVT